MVLQDAGFAMERPALKIFSAPAELASMAYALNPPKLPACPRVMDGQAHLWRWPDIVLDPKPEPWYLKALPRRKMIRWLLLHRPALEKIPGQIILCWLACLACLRAR